MGVVLGHEGGFSNNPLDRGGATNFGVVQKRYDEYRRDRKQELRPVVMITQEEVKDIYSTYWRDAKCSYMPEPLDLLMFDSAINHGAGRAIRILQRVLGCDEDGVAGRDTMNALHEEVVTMGIQHVVDAYLREREAFYDKIVQGDPTQAVFMKGWMNRVDHLRSLVA